MPEEKKYRLLYYGMHTSKNVYKFDQEEDVVKQIIKKSMLKQKIRGRALLEVRTLKKLLKKNDDKRTLGVYIRVSVKEKKSILFKAQNRGLEVSDYIRMKLFS